MSLTTLPPLDPEIDNLLDSERNPPSAPEVSRARVQQRLGVTLGFAPPVALPRALQPSASGVTSATALKLGVALLAIGGAGAGGWLLTHRPTAAKVITSPAAVPAPAPAPVLEQDSPSVSAPPLAPHHRVNVAAPVEDLAAERALLDGARSALAARDAPRALALTADHAREFPRGQLAEERESIVVKALVTSAQPDAARARAARFHRAHPHSIFLPAVDAAIESIP